MAGAVVALAVTAPVDDLVEGWAQLGQRHGLAGLGALLAAAVVFAWSARRPVRHAVRVRPARARGGARVRDRRVAAPRRTRSGHGSSVAGLLAAAVQVGPLRRRLTVDPCWSRAGRRSRWASSPPGRSTTRWSPSSTTAPTTGWESIALATGAAFLFALAFREPRPRTNALWLPFLLAAQLCAMLLPGQYPLVGVAALSALAGVVALVWPSIARGTARPAGPADARPHRRCRERGGGAVRLRDAEHALPDVTRSRGRPGRRDGGDGRAPGGGRRDPACSLLDLRRARRHPRSSTPAGPHACGRLPPRSSAPSSS